MCANGYHVQRGNAPESLTFDKGGGQDDFFVFADPEKLFIDYIELIEPVAPELELTRVKGRTT